MMQKMILQNLKNHKNHGLLNSKHMDIAPLIAIFMWIMLQSIHRWGVC
jgi:hypothetical protein